MAVVGLDNAMININNVTHVLDHSFLGTSKADIKNLEGNNTALNGSNEVQLYYKEPAHPTVTLTVNDMPADLLAQLVGASALQQGGGLYAEGQSSVSPVSGLCIVSPKLGEDKDMVYIFPKCHVTYQTASLSTNTESKRNIVPIQLTFSAVYDPATKTSAIWGEVDHGKAADTVTKQLSWSEPASDGEYKDAGSAVIAPKTGN